jgi:hypothetical protein
MSFQEIAEVTAVLAAASYLGLRGYRALRKKGCASGCGACSTIDFARIEARAKAAEAKKKA